MAQEVKVVLLCDRCETRTEAETTEAVGPDRELDLCAKHKKELEKTMAPWVGAARRISGAKTGGVMRRRQRGSGATQPPYNEQHCRSWAMKQGLNVKAEGRLSPTTIAKWREAGSPAA